MRTPTLLLVAWAASLSLASACSPPRITEGLFACESDEECPPGWSCGDDERCHSSADDHDASTDIDAAIDGGCADCPTCGDGTCDASESCESCEADCGACPRCGDGTCDEGESCGSCAGDCGACPSTCGDGVCDAGESCGQCTECWIGHLGRGNDGDPCPASLVDQWRCVRSSEQGDQWVSQSCQDTRGGYYWLTFGVNPRDCRACVCGMSVACCRAGSSQIGCQ